MPHRPEYYNKSTRYLVMVVMLCYEYLFIVEASATQMEVRHLPRTDQVVLFCLYVLLVLSVVGVFVIPASQTQNFLTYLLGSVILIEIFRSKVQGLDVESIGFFGWTAVLLTWLAASIFWSDGVFGHGVIRSFGNLLLMLTYMLAIIVVVRRFERAPVVLFQAIMFGAMVSAIWTISERLQGWGVAGLFNSWRLGGITHSLSNPVIAGMMYGLAAQLAFSLMLLDDRRRVRSIYGVIAFLAFLAVLLTRSRSPLLSLAIANSLALALHLDLVNITARKVIALLLTVIAVVYASVIWLTAMESRPEDYSNEERRTFLLNENSEFNQSSLSGSRGVAVGYGAPDVSLRVENGELVIPATTNFAGVAAVWPVMEMHEGSSIFIHARLRSASSGEPSGVYVQVDEAYTNTGKAITRFADPDSQQEAIRELNLATLESSTEGWQEFIVRYEPSADARYFSPLVLNQTGRLGVDLREGGDDVYVDFLRVYAIPKAPVERLVDRVTPHLSVQAFRRSEAVRGFIWLEGVQTIAQNPLTGFGIGASSKVALGNGKTYDHYHSLFISTLHYAGIVGLTILFVWLILLSGEIDRIAALPVRRLFISLLVYCILIFVVDGDKLLTKINHIWMTLLLLGALATAIARKSGQTRF